jgi:glutamate/tyrosine decarboxylase-like PLP-dependent enzyme
MPETGAETPMINLDPADWDEFRALAHRMLDDAIDDIATLDGQPVWRPMPPAIRSAWREALPHDASPAEAVYDEYRRLIAPYASGNRHGGFFGWVQGGGTALGMLADMLAAGLNANMGGRDHAAILCERQVIGWAAEMLGLPPEASGLLVTGTSVANLMAVLVARTAALGPDCRTNGTADSRITAYAAAGAHFCVSRAMDMAGLGTDALRLVPGDADGRIDTDCLKAICADDRMAGKQPFLVVGTAGGVDTGAVDDLTALAAICRDQGMWFHIDAAFGAIVRLSPRYRPLLNGIEQADSVAFDFHKWAQIPYDAGCLIVRDPKAHVAAFAQPASYLARGTRGLSAGSPWPCDLGPDLSRGFRALKVWMALKVFGADRLGRIVEQSCDLARYLAARIDAHPGLERAAPVALNIVCFRCAGLDDHAHAELAADIQESGIAAPSTTQLNGKVVLRAAIVNHRTTGRDIDRLLDAVLAGAERYRGAGGSAGCK